MKYVVLAMAGFFGMTAVILGAFGAHALKDLLEPEQLNSYHTAVEYQFYHTFALFVTYRLWERTHYKILQWAGICFILGILLFSGSIYLLSTGDLSGLAGATWLGPITPIGGTFFIIGWALLIVTALKKQAKKRRAHG